MEAGEMPPGAQGTPQLNLAVRPPPALSSTTGAERLHDSWTPHMHDNVGMGAAMLGLALHLGMWERAHAGRAAQLSCSACILSFSVMVQLLQALLCSSGGGGGGGGMDRGNFVMQEADDSQERLRVLQLQALLATLQVHPDYSFTRPGPPFCLAFDFLLKLTVKKTSQQVLEGLLPWNALIRARYFDTGALAWLLCMPSLGKV